MGINDPKLKIGYLGNLGKKTKLELEELISRQDKLLSNTDFLAKLKDGGHRLRGRREQLQQALNKLEESNKDHSALLLIPDISALEWQWRSGSPMCDQKEETDPLDSDDDEDINPLHLLAMHSMDAPPRMTGAPSLHSLEGEKYDIDPSDSIREELRKLDIRDQIAEVNKLRSASHDYDSKANKLDLDLAQDFGSKMLISLEKKCELKSKKEVFKPFRPKNKQNLLSQTTIKFNSISDAQTLCHGTSHSYVTTSNTYTATTTIAMAAVNPLFGVSAPPTFPSLKTINVMGPKARRSALWACESAATGPLAAGAGRSVQLIPLRESVKLERQANERLKELQLQRTTGTSSSVSGGFTDNKRSSLFAYRDKNAMDTFLNDGESDDDLVEDLLSSKMIAQDDIVDNSSDGEEED